MPTKCTRKCVCLLLSMALVTRQNFPPPLHPSTSTSKACITSSDPIIPAPSLFCIVSQRMIRMLLDATPGRRAGNVWGTEAFSHAIILAGGRGLAKTAHMLITAEGEGRQRRWARVNVGDMMPLFGAAVLGSFTTVGVLLAAGADENTRDADGHPAGDYAAMGLPAGDTSAGSKASAVKRTLQRAPAYRARSWVWSAAVVSSQRGGAAAAAAIEGLHESSPPPLGVRVFRQRGPRFFTTRFTR